MDGRRVEAVTKSQGEDDSTGGIRSPTPPSSQGSKSNSPLLNGYANGAPPPINSQLFGKYDGFTLSPVREKPESLTPIGTDPDLPPSYEEAQKASSLTSPSSLKAAPWKVKPNPLPQNVWPPPKTQVDISGPSLQASTNPAVKAPPSAGFSPSRPAPQRPKSVPDASSLIVANVFPSAPPAEEIGREQGKPSAVARIASFLTKKERSESPPVEGTPVRQYNTLPRKAAKINRESLLQLEISPPMQLQATELPSNLVPVRPAPEIPMPGNLKPSEVKASQDKGKEVSWAPAVSECDEDAGKNELLRIGSVREPSVTQRPSIPKFGSMRAPRPKSLPPPRPSQPPPRPPLPVIPGTPESEYFYDDCITVQIEAPLAREEEKSPSQEEIYATIDEEPSPKEEAPAEKEKKKGLFSMLYSKTKKKKPAERETSEPLYCNISPSSEDKNSTHLSERNESPVTPSRSSSEDGGLLSEIVTELATREPQYVNTLSKDKKSPSHKNEANTLDQSSVGKISPKKSPSRSSSTVTSPFQSPRSPSPPKMSSPDSEKTKSPYVPYSSLKPRGVFSFFKSSPSSLETASTSPHSSPTKVSGASSPVETPNEPEKPKLQDASPLQTSLAEVKAGVAEIKSSICSDKSVDTSTKSSLPNPSPTDEKTKVGSLQPKNGPGTKTSSLGQNKLKTPGGVTTGTSGNTKTPTSNSVTAAPSSSNTTGLTRTRPVFPPDKVLHPPSAKSKIGSGSMTSKKSTTALDNSRSSLRTKGPATASGASNKPRVVSPTSKTTANDSTKGPTGRPSSQKHISEDKKEIKGASGLSTKKTQAQSGATKNESRGRSTDKEKETTLSSKDTAPAENKSATKKSGGRLVSPPRKPLGVTSASKSSVLAAAAKSGPQGTSHVASLQQKFEKETQAAKAASKGPYKKTTPGKGLSKQK